MGCQRVGLYWSTALLITLLVLPSSAQNVSVSKKSYPYSDYASIIARGDFNNDGREDFILVMQPAGPCCPTTSEQDIVLSNGDGTYNSPVPIAFSGGLLQAADFNQDGNLDLIGSDNSGNATVLKVSLGNGNGSFQASRDTTLAGSAEDRVAVEDVNHDGKTDVAYVVGEGSEGSVYALLGNGDGTFTSLPPFTSMVVGLPLSGDFDGDGKADIAIVYSFGGTIDVQVWYGDNTGHFGSPTRYTQFGNIWFPNTSQDVNGDGRSDVVAGYRAFDGPNLGVGVLYGNANRTVTFSRIANSQCARMIFDKVNVADFNGDGRNDLQYSETDCVSGNNPPPTHVVVQLGLGGGSFAPEKTIYTSQLAAGGDAVAIRANRDTKPDIAFTEWTAVQPMPPTELTLLLNTTAGAFPGCAAPNTIRGINVCTPGTSSGTNVPFAIGAAGALSMRKVEVWVDGTKKLEQRRAFSDYSFLASPLSLSVGSHRISIFAGPWDGSVQSKSFTLSVSSSQCPAPGSSGVNICSPIQGTITGSPVKTVARALVSGTYSRMELWVDGVKRTSTTSTLMSTSVSVGTGTHRFSFIAVNTGGTKFTKAVYVSVH